MVVLSVMEADTVCSNIPVYNVVAWALLAYHETWTRAICLGRLDERLFVE